MVNIAVCMVNIARADSYILLGLSQGLGQSSQRLGKSSHSLGQTSQTLGQTSLDWQNQVVECSSSGYSIFTMFTLSTPYVHNRTGCQSTDCRLVNIVYIEKEILSCAHVSARERKGACKRANVRKRAIVHVSFTHIRVNP